MRCFSKYGFPFKQVVFYIGNEPLRKIFGKQIRVLRLKFAVVDLEKIPKEVFLCSDIPAEVVPAVLFDFCTDRDQPEQVIRQVLQHLLKLVAGAAFEKISATTASAAALAQVGSSNQKKKLLLCQYTMTSNPMALSQRYRTGH